MPFVVCCDRMPVLALGTRMKLNDGQSRRTIAVFLVALTYGSMEHPMMRGTHT